MKLGLHANATTTPKTRAYIQTSKASVADLARELGVSETTVRRWCGRKGQADRSHARHQLGQSTTPAEEAIIASLRRQARLSLDDIVEVMRRCVSANLSRSAIWRRLVRQGLNGPLAADPPKAPSQPFEETAFGYVHVDLKYLGKLKSLREYAFVAIERVTRFAHVEIIPDRRPGTVAKAMARFLKAFGHPVHTVLTDNGLEFTDRFHRGLRTAHDEAASGRHPFDRLCAAHGAKHRLTRPYRPQTNGLVERFNRRLGEAIKAQPQARQNSRHRTNFLSHDERAAFIADFVEAYNRTRLRCLDYRAPLEMLNNQAEDNTGGWAAAALGASTKPSKFHMRLLSARVIGMRRPRQATIAKTECGSAPLASLSCGGPL